MTEVTWKRTLKEVVRAWDALPGGQRYHPSDVQRWLVEDMKPAIDAARVALTAAEKAQTS